MFAPPAFAMLVRLLAPPPTPFGINLLVGEECGKAADDWHASQQTY
jgi:hypothetical protein